MKNDLKHNKKRNSVMLCCGGKACPEVYARSKDKIQIRDDDGYIITITKEQARMIPEAVALIDENNDN